MDSKYFYILFTCWLSLADSLRVSFYGGSHIAMPIQEAKISTNVRLKFRTHRENSLIFLAAGRTDYVLLSLDGGRVQFFYKINEHLLEMWSPKPLMFNDLQWHDVSISRYETNITLQIDQHFIRKTLPSNTLELNIHFGVFLGGLGDFSASYLNALDNFRGCISDVYYNNINVFKRARERTSHVTSVKISWNCASEFDADAHQSISFIEDDSYMMFSKAPILYGDNWSLELRTIEALSTIIYNSGTSLRHDFMSLEIVDSKLRLLVGKGSNAVELVPDRNVSDGKWHNVTLSYSPANVEITVDDNYYSANFANSSRQIIELGEDFFIGGLESSKRKKAIMKGLRSVEANYRGCIRNVIVNNQFVGFPNMKVTQGVTVDCVWKFPCLKRDPCIISANCQQHGIDEFICYCDQAYCIKADFTDKYKIFSRSDLPMEIEILSITPMQLMEGDSIFLTNSYIDVLFDFSKLGITESGIIFHVVQPPKYGKITITPFGAEVLNITESKYFSLIDLGMDKVKYTHNGMEQFVDHMTIDLQLISNTREILPEFLQGKHRFVLHVNITAVNDAPFLRIPNSKILRLTQGISKIIGPDILYAEDPDSHPSVLIYTILSLDSDKEYGQFEMGGKTITSFTQMDINQGLLSYIVNNQNPEDMSFEIGIQVSDGMETSQTIFLGVSVVQLQLRMVNNTGLMLVHKSMSVITNSNLSFISNSDDDTVDVKFNIVNPPTFGYLQKLRTVDSSWITVDSFTSNQILLGQIRYIHVTDFPMHDEFKFTATLGQITTAKYDFRIVFTKLKIGEQRCINLDINGNNETILSNDYLMHQTTPIHTFPRNIIYTMVKAPKYGQIFIEGYQEFAKAMDSFTQNDVDKNLIRFRTHRTSYSSFSDSIEFVVSVSECEDVICNLEISYSPLEKFTRQLLYQKSNKIEVIEGERTILSRINFDILFNKFNTLSFNISEMPKHGNLCNYDEIKSDILVINSFKLDNLYLGDVYYCHDDTESINDSFKLLIVSDVFTDFQYIAEIYVIVILRNDNAPVQSFNKIFHIVRNETKFLTDNDLNYIDPDINTNVTDLFYSHLTITNGELLKNGLVIDNFNQDDIKNQRILYQHFGTDEGKMYFTVTDGLYEVQGDLDVVASDPFLKLRESNASVAQESKMISIKSNDLSIETNLNTKPEDIEYKILDGPNYGILRILRKKYNATAIPRFVNMTSIKNFTQMEIDKERLVYLNTEVASMDKIKFRVTTKGIWTEGEILIRIYPVAYWELLQIRRNQTLYVEESTSVVITRDILEIIHPNISPGDITYLVTTSPQHGYLEVQSITSDDEYNCKVFDQSTINSEKMFYIQAGVNQSTDYFIFDVTNGITWLKDLILKIVIIPENIYMNTKNVSVEEGGSVKFQAEDMVPFSEYYQGKILEYKVIQQPIFGSIMSGKSSKVNRFTQKQLEAGIIQYYHNGSENSTDVIMLKAVTRFKESVMFDLVIVISPVNDELPQVITNTGLHMWIGGKSVIKNTDLMAQDYDTSPENLTFIIQETLGGYLIAKADLKTKIFLFTQKQINHDEIYFIHDSNHLNGKMLFYVSDGAHNTTEHTLYITTNPITLEQVKNDMLHVFPLTRKQLLPDQLQYKCSDIDRDVKYIITIPPQMGRILYEYTDSGHTTEIGEFTQADLNSGRILYEHTHSMVELKTNDSFYFDITANLASSLIDQVFHIEISVSSGGLLRFLPVPRITLDEGDLAPIKLDLSKVLEYLETRAGIQSPELFIESYPPNFGSVELLNFKKNSSKFTLNDFNLGRVYYKHDHSDTMEDTILMSVFLSPGQIFLCNLTIPVTINPINDQPFQLITPSPHMTVIEGENRTITQIELLTEDADTSPDGIIYDVISGPTLGVLLKVSDEDVFQDIITYGNRFSQSDINEGRIIYAHSGSPMSTTFYFKVSDTKFKPAYEIFNIKINPITILPGYQIEHILVPQGLNTASIETKHISVETNVHRDKFMYNISKSPNCGIILANNKPVLRFSHSYLVENRISYMQTDMTKSNDTFQVNAFIPDTNYGAMIELKVIVNPFITINDLSVPFGDKVRLTTTFISDNPTQIKLNRYNPKISISVKPRFGKLKKIVRNSGDTAENQRDKDLTQFTYKELKSGVIYYVAKKIFNDFNSINDSFEFFLTIKAVQPGQGIVKINLYSPSKKALDGLNSDVNVISADSSFPIDYLILISIVACLIIFLLIIIIILKCRGGGKANKNADKSEYTTQLAHTNDFMLMNNNRIYSSSENDSIPATASSTPLPVMSNVPHCKVIPIGIENDLQDSENDEILDLDHHHSALRYPYGEEIDESWSSLGDVGNDINYSTISPFQQVKRNPELRGNQYWV